MLWCKSELFRFSQVQMKQIEKTKYSVMHCRHSICISFWNSRLIIKWKGCLWEERTQGQHTKIVFRQIIKSKDTKPKIGIFRQTDMYPTSMGCNKASMERQHYSVSTQRHVKTTQNKIGDSVLSWIFICSNAVCEAVYAPTHWHWLQWYLI